MLHKTFKIQILLKNSKYIKQIISIKLQFIFQLTPV